MRCCYERPRWKLWLYGSFIHCIIEVVLVQITVSLADYLELGVLLEYSRLLLQLLLLKHVVVVHLHLVHNHLEMPAHLVRIVLVQIEHSVFESVQCVLT